MAKTISQRISLEGSEDIRKKLEQLGKTGEQAFKQIQDAAKKPVTDPAQIERTQQAVEQLVTASQQLATQFSGLSGSTQQFGRSGTQAANQVTGALNETGKAAEQVGNGLQVSALKFGAISGAVAGVFQAATTKLIGIVGQLSAAFAPSALLKGMIESSKIISEQADKLKLTVEQWLVLRKEIAASGISADEFVKSTAGLVKKLDESKGGVARLSDSVTETTNKFGDSVVTILRFNDKMTQGGKQANQFATELAKLGFEGSKALRLFAAGDTPGALRAVANAIAGIADEQKRADAGVKLFGENWKATIGILRGGAEGINDVVEAQKAARRAARELMGDQIKAATELREKWKAQEEAVKDLSAAVRSLKDHIGALFIGGATTRANWITDTLEWLTEMVDGARKLLQMFLKLTEAEEKLAFVAGLGESPAEVLFKTLIALGGQLSGIWRDILVPAGNALVNIFKQISGQFEGVSKSQVAAFFITATAAAIGLSLAFKAIGLVLAPLLLLFTPFGAILLAAGAAAVRFWGVLAAGAQRVAVLIPNSLALISTAIRNLFAGNFAKAWAQFAEGATAAFGTVAQAAVRAQGPIGAVARAIQRIATDFPGAINLMVTVLIGLGVAATGVADVINQIFGSKLTGTDIALIVIVAQLTGGLAALASISVIVSSAIGILIGLFGGFVTAIILAGAALVTYMGWWPQVSAVASAAMTLISQAWQGFTKIFMAGIQIISNAWQSFTQIFMAGIQIISNAWDTLKNAGVAAWDAIKGAIEGVIGVINAVIEAIGNALKKLAELLFASKDVGTPGGGLTDTGGHARGGLLGGRGTGTSDSNLAWVSRGEHIMPARAVRQPGVLAFLEALRRSGGNLSRVLDGMGRFALGGLVLPSFAEGGLNGMSNVTIQFPGLQPIGGLRAPADVVEELRKAAAMAQVRSGGRKPSRYS